MIKKVYFLKTDGYNMLVSVDEKKNCRYLTETSDFPYLLGMEDDKQKQAAVMQFLESVEDDSSWEDDCSYFQIFEEFQEDIEILGEVEKYL